MKDNGDTSVATSPASGEEAAINLFLAIGSLSSPSHMQRLRIKVAAMASTYQWFWGWCVSVRAEIFGVCGVCGGGARWCLRKDHGN